MFREDYYKFSHSLFPHMVLNYKDMTIDKLMKGEEEFNLSIKNAWRRIEVVADQVRNEPPDFKLEIKYIDVIRTLVILSMPSAVNAYETPYIGVLFDNQNNVRYFTYEIGEVEKDKSIYCICEWASVDKHINHSVHDTLDKNIFIDKISNISLYDLF